MRESRWCLFDGIRRWIVAIGMLIAATLVVAACTSDGDTTGFPTGRFVHEHLPGEIFEFDEDGTYRYYWSADYSGEPTVQGKYGVNGNLYTEMTHDYPTSPKIPATYTWTYDGQKLTFHLWGKDVNAHRKSVYDGQTYIKVE
jgi:hypothetical protein